MKLTEHFRTRSAQRGLRWEVFSFLVYFGQETRVDGTVYTTLVRRRVPPGEDRRLAEKARGWVLVGCPDGTYITCYRSSDAVAEVASKIRPHSTAYVV
jgi:hypothetical protein